MLNILNAIQYEFDTTRPIDDDLILKTAQGDMTAFRELYESASKSVYCFALSIIKNTDDAEDILQETFLKVYFNAGSYIPKNKPMAWIFTITRNLALTKLRKKSKELDYDESICEKTDFTSVTNAEQRILLETIFDILNDEEKQVLILHAVSGLKYREIASVLDMPVNTVLSKYHRAVKKLKIAVGEEQI